VKYPSSIYAEIVQFNIGWTYFSKDRFQEAITEFRTVGRKFPESQLMPRVLFNSGDAFFNLKSYDSARVYYQRVVREYPSSPLVTDALAGLQYTSQAQGKPGQAIAEIDTFLTQKPAGLSQEDLLLRKAGILFDEGDYAGALPEYQRLLSSKPRPEVGAKAQYQMGRIYELENNPSRAITFYQRVAGMDSVDNETRPAVALALGLAHLRLKQYRAAAEDLQGFDKRFPDSPLKVEAGYQLGIAQMNIPAYPAALTQFQSIIQSHPEDIFADRSRLQIGHIYLERKEYSSALDTLNVLVNKRGDDLAAEALVTIGDTYLAQKKFRDALQAYHDVIQQFTDYPIKVEKARFGLGQTYERMSDRKQARLAYQEILKSPVDPEVKASAEQRLRKLKK
jgi:TolA-binding protein